MIGLLTSVQPQVSLQVALLVERLFAIIERADKIFSACMPLQMHFQTLLSIKGRPAALNRTDEILLVFVRVCVVSQMPL